LYDRCHSCVLHDAKIQKSYKVYRQIASYFSAQIAICKSSVSKKGKGRRGQGCQSTSAFPELPDSDEAVLEYGEFLEGYMHWIAGPVFLENLDKIYPEFDWEQDDDGVWFSTTIPEDDPDCENLGSVNSFL